MVGPEFSEGVLRGDDDELGADAHGSIFDFSDEGVSVRPYLKEIGESDRERTGIFNDDDVFEVVAVPPLVERLNKCIGIEVACCTRFAGTCGSCKQEALERSLDSSEFSLAMATVFSAESLVMKYLLAGGYAAEVVRVDCFQDSVPVLGSFGAFVEGVGGTLSVDEGVSVFEAVVPCLRERSTASLQVISAKVVAYESLDGSSVGKLKEDLEMGSSGFSDFFSEHAG